MPRHLRAVEPGFAHHVTQRGVDRQKVFFNTGDRNTYLELLKENLTQTDVTVFAYCLMTNHVHWIVVPQTEDSLAILFRRVHGRYAQYLNARRGRTGHLWQNRYFSCLVAPSRLHGAIRYVELNPVRAGLVRSPGDYRWSSAPAHLRDSPAPHETVVPLDWSPWYALAGPVGWRDLLDARESPADIAELRKCTYSGKPNGSQEFVKEMEGRFGRHWNGRGRPPKTIKEAEQSASFSG
jgi:putative transposase